MVNALLNDEQQMLQEMARSLASSVRVSTPHDLEEVDRAKGWSSLADAGVLGLRVRDESGRPTGSGVEVMLVAEALGGALAPVPYLGSAVLAAELLALAGAPASWQESAAAGADRYTVLLTPDLSQIARLDTEAEPALAFDSAGAAYGLALSEDRLVRVRLGDDAVRRQSADPTRHITESGRATAGEEFGDAGPELLGRWRALGLTAVSADAVGAMRAALDGVVAYSRDRIAYGVPIGSFQAIQHMCADAFVHCEAAASCVGYAAWAVDELDPAEALLAAYTAKSYVALTALEVTETVMQVYGGIGQTWEHVAHLYNRRALLDRRLLGDAAENLAHVADLRLGER